METGSKFWFSRLFRSSLESCWDENASDMVHEPVFVTKGAIFSFFPVHKGRMIPSLGCACRPRRWSSWASGSRRSGTIISESEDPDSVASFRKMLVRITSQTRAEDHESRFPVDDGRRTGSPDPLMIPDSDCDHGGVAENGDYYGEKTMKKKKQKRKCVGRRKKRKRERNTLLSTSSSVKGWFSSEKGKELVDDAESEKLNFSNSTGSYEYSSETFGFSRRQPHLRYYGRNPWNDVPSMGIKVRESVAVVMSSIDPYVDFMESMVEMIVAKQIFDDHELEEMLHCFLSLNSAHHHSAIIKAFSDVWSALFSDE